MEKEINTSGKMTWGFIWRFILYYICLLYTSDAADE